MKKDVVIVGGGIVGLMCAYHLCQTGKKVTIIDKSNIMDGTSFGNAGLLSPFQKNPLSYPGVVVDTLKLMLRGESRINIHPSLNPKLYRWLWKFIQSSNPDRLKKTLILFEKYGEISLDIYKSLNLQKDFDFNLLTNGILMVYTKQKSFISKVQDVQNKSNFSIYNQQKTKEFFPLLNDNIQGSVLLQENASLDPVQLMQQMKAYLIKQGVEFILNEKINDIEFENDQVTKLISEKNTYEPEICILATGVDDALIKKVNNNYLMLPAKGYSITFEIEELLKPKVPMLFPDLFIAMTPHKNSMRITSKLELGINKNLNRKQLDSMIKKLQYCTKGFNINQPVEWYGFRPLTPNDMPILGYDKRYSNLIHANGLGWLGITFSPAVGKIITDLIIKDKSNSKNNDILLFSSFYQG